MYVRFNTETRSDYRILACSNLFTPFSPLGWDSFSLFIIFVIIKHTLYKIYMYIHSLFTYQNLCSYISAINIKYCVCKFYSQLCNMLIAEKLITTQERDVTTRRLRHCIVTSHDNQSQLQHVALYYVNVITSKEIGIKYCSCVPSLSSSFSWKMHINLRVSPSSALWLQLLFLPELSDMQIASLRVTLCCIIYDYAAVIRHDFRGEKNLFCIKCVYLFCVLTLSETIFIPRRIQRDIAINWRKWSCKVIM